MASVALFSSGGRLHPISDLYFCQNCKLGEGGDARTRLKGALEIVDEIDGLSCPLCLESVPPVEAGLFGHRCARCFQCPVCGSYLQTSLAPSPPDIHSFLCCSCSWDSSNSGLTSIEAQSLVLAALKLEKAQRGSDILDKLVGSIAESLRSDAQAPPPTDHQGQNRPDESWAAFATRCNISQRNRAPGGSQPRTLSNMLPVRAPLTPRITRRCTDCMRILSKRDANPTSVQFRVNLAASILLPSIYVMEHRGGEAGVVRLSIHNPSDSTAKITVSDGRGEAPNKPPMWPTGQMGGRYWGGACAGEWGRIEFGGGGKTWVGKAAEASDGLWEDEEGDEEVGQADVGMGLVISRSRGRVVIEARVMPQDTAGAGTRLSTLVCMKLAIESSSGRVAGGEAATAGLWWFLVCVRVQLP